MDTKALAGGEPQPQITVEKISPEEADRVFATPPAAAPQDEEVFGGAAEAVAPPVVTDKGPVIDEDEEVAREAAAEEDKPLPEWAQAAIPKNLKIPPGKRLSFLRLRGEWTEAPHKGDRVIVMWALDVDEEITAIDRARGSDSRVTAERVMMSIRAIDGRRVAWDAGGGAVRAFWKEIGAPCRGAVSMMHVKMHQLTRAKLIDFLGTCYEERRASG